MAFRAHTLIPPLVKGTTSMHYAQWYQTKYSGGAYSRLQALAEGLTISQD